MTVRASRGVHGQVHGSALARAEARGTTRGGIVTGTHLPRRAVLRGLGVSLALPLLDCMVPAFAATPTPIRRFGAFYVPMGMDMARFVPRKEGALELTPIMHAVADYKDRLLVVSGLYNKEADGNDIGYHPKSQTTWLTGARANRSEGIDVRCGVSMDQVLAHAIGQDTQLASVELALESSELLGACSLGYSCTYTSTISWRDAKTPLPMEQNPRLVFERLFGASDSTDARTRLAQASSDRSILDAVTQKVARLEKGIGVSDRSKLSQYLDAVRDVERRIQKVEAQSSRELPVIDKPVGVPSSFEEHAKLMYDLLVLAYQTDLTRVGSMMVGRELSIRTFPEAGISESWHPLSHHQDSPEKLARQYKLNLYHLRVFSYLLDKLKDTPDGDGSLLDHTLLLYGSGMSNSNVHSPEDVPTMVFAGSAFGITGNRHVRYTGRPSLANLQLTLINRFGVDAKQFGDSVGPLAEI